MKPSIRSAVAAALAGLLLIGAAARPASADPVAGSPDPGSSFDAVPAPGSSTEPAGGYFEVDATPGETVTQSIALRNDSDEPVELHLAGVDAGTAQMGGSSFGLDTEVPVDAGTWLTLDRTVVTLEAGASLSLPFRIAVPDDAASGVHLAGISIMEPVLAEPGGASSDADAGATITVQSRRVVAVQVNVPGPAEPELVITGVTPVARPDGLYLEIAIDNRGRGLTHGEGDISLPGAGFARDFSVGTFVPGTSIAYPIRWTDDEAHGDHRAHVEIRYGDRVAEWDGVFTVGAAVADDQANRQLPSPAEVGGPSTDGGRGFPRLALLAVALGAFLVLGAGVAVGRRSRRE